MAIKNCLPSTKIIPVLSAIVYLLIITFLSAYSYLRWMPFTLLNHRVILQPYLLENDFIPYKHIADQKTPLLPEILSWLLPVFEGNALRTARLFHAFIIIATVIIVLGWTYKAKGKWAMVASGAFFLAWSHYFGYWAIAYYDVVLGLLFLAVFVLLISGNEKGVPWRSIGIGLVSGIAILLKQQAVILVALYIGWIVWHSFKSRVNPQQIIVSFLLFTISLCLPLLAYSAHYVNIGGDIKDLVYWTVIFNFTSNYKTEGALAPNTTQVLQILPAFILTIPYASSLWMSRENQKPSQNTRLWLLIFFFGSTLTLLPRYSARHWATAFPFLVVISGISCADILDHGYKNKNWNYQSSLYTAFTIWWMLSAFLVYWPRVIKPAPQQFSEYSNLVPLAKALKERISTERGVVLFPVDEGNGNLYYLLQQNPPRYYTVFYPWFMNEITSNNWLHAVDKEKPQTLIFFKNRVWPSNHISRILDYINNNYQYVETLNWEGDEVELMRRIENK